MVTPLAKAIGHDRGKQHEFYEEYLELYDEARKATNFKEEFDEFFEQKVEYEDIKSVRWLKQEIKFLNHVISYSKVRRKMIFIPLTVDGMRDYYRKKTKKFDLIPVYFSSNDYVNLFGPVGMNSSYKEGEKLEFREFFTDAFYPTGTLIKSTNGKDEFFPDWFKLNKTGPYTEDALNRNMKDRYYVQGYLEEGFGGKCEEYDLQICSGPILNAISNNCANGLVYIFGGYYRSRKKK